MRKSMLLFAGLACALAGQTPAHAGAAGSLWNGETFELPGTFVVQDADRPNEFYWTPFRYSLDTRLVAVHQAHGPIQWRQDQKLTHAVVSTPDQKKWSVYTFHVTLEQLDPMTAARAQNEIQDRVGDEAELKGMLPVCGIHSGMPTVVGTGTSPAGSGRITLGFSETPKGSCSLAGAPEDFSVEVSVPLESEPSIAKALVTGAGIPLPTVELDHPYKYHDKASLHIETRDMLDYFHEGFSLAGAFKFVQLSLGQQLSDMIHAYQGLGTMTFDIPNPDPLVHQRFEKILTDALESMFFKFVPVDATLPNTSDPSSDCSSVGSVGNSGGGVQAPYCVKAQLTLNQQTVSNHRTIDINIDNVDYGTITSEAEIYLPAIDCGKLAPEVRELLLKQADDSIRAACAPSAGTPTGARP